MGQQDIINILRRENSFLSRTQIAEKLKIRPELVSTHLKKLLKTGDVIFKELNRLEARQYCKTVMRRMKVYKINL